MKIIDEVINVRLIDRMLKLFKDLYILSKWNRIYYVKN